MKAYVLALTVLLSTTIAAPADTTYAALAARDKAAPWSGLVGGSLGGPTKERRDGSNKTAQSKEALKEAIQAAQGEDADFDLTDLLDFIKQKSKGLDTPGKRGLTERAASEQVQKTSFATYGKLLKQAYAGLSTTQTKELQNSLKNLKLDNAEQLSNALDSLTTSQVSQLKQTLSQTIGTGSIGNLLADIVEVIPTVGQKLANLLRNLPIKERDISERDVAETSVQTGAVGNILGNLLYKLAFALDGISLKRDVTSAAGNAERALDLGGLLYTVLTDLGDLLYQLPLKKREVALQAAQSAQLSQALKSITDAQATQVSQAYKSLQSTGPIGYALAELVGSLPVVGDLLKEVALVLPIKRAEGQQSNQTLTTEQTEQLQEAVKSVASDQSTELVAALKKLKASSSFGSQLADLIEKLPFIGPLFKSFESALNSRSEAAQAGSGGDLVDSLVDTVIQILQALINLVKGITGKVTTSSTSAVPGVSDILSALTSIISKRGVSV